MRIEIVESLKEKWAYDLKYAKAAGDGKIKPRKAEKTLVLTPETFAKIFSPQRIKLILKAKNNDKNIYQLAKELKRKYEAVHRDVMLLAGFGIIKIKSKERSKIPCAIEKIEIPCFSA